LRESEEILHLKEVINGLLFRIDVLEQENTELRARLSQNSGNSSRPPSSDGYRKRSYTDILQDGVAKKKRGGQVGHKGSTLHQVSHPDFIIEHKPEECIYGHHFGSASEYELSEKRQVFEIPPPKIDVYEHRIYRIQCPVCEKTHKAEFPPEVTSPAQYGNRMKTFIAVLNFDKLDDCDKILQRLIFTSEVVNADETGIRINKKTSWLHNYSTPLYAYLFPHLKRGMEAIEKSGTALKDYTGWLIHDCWKPYFKLTNANHGLCNAHILRELQLKVEYDHICHFARHEEPPPIQNPVIKKGRKKKSKAMNLLERLIGYKDHVLAFAFNENVPFTNNLAERDLRTAKIKMKVSNCFRAFQST
jgi:transposase